MSLYGVLRTGVSGMNAQSNLLGTVADNIANSSTTGYKRASVEFSSLLLQSGHGDYSSGAVVSEVRRAVSDQGPLSYTTSDTDLAIQGDGFFIVTDATDTPYLTRAGSFTLDGASGNLVNSAGYTLMGYDLAAGAPGGVLNGYAGLVPVNMSSMTMRAAASTTGEFMANLPFTAAVVAAPHPSANDPASTYSEKASVVAYDNVGSEVTLDIYMTKTSDTPDTWEYSVFDQSEATGGGFPYSSGPLSTTSVTFDGNGQLSGATSLSVPVPNGQTLTIDLTGTTQLATTYTPVDVDVDGNAPASLDGITISDDGTVYANYSNGAVTPTYRLPLADVPSPDKLQALAGNVFAVTPASGDVRIGLPNEAGLGKMVAGALEQSNVDMASELTEMIVAQRDYTANSKVFQTGSELLEVLMNLKR